MKTIYGRRLTLLVEIKRNVAFLQLDEVMGGKTPPLGLTALTCKHMSFVHFSTNNNSLTNKKHGSAENKTNKIIITLEQLLLFSMENYMKNKT